MKIDDDYLAKGELMDAQCTYTLKSVICHIGTLDRGHYYAYAYNETSKSWFHCSDEKIGECSKADVRDNNAYI
jgi:ubiquitin carboxyl-terminal hydrolase 22/27/51